MNLMQYVVRRLNVKAAAMLIALILSISGVTMIFLGIRDTGVIDIKSTFLTGQAQSGFVGISLIFVALFIAVACIFSRKSNKKVVIKCGEVEVQFGGQIKSDEDRNGVKSTLDPCC